MVSLKKIKIYWKYFLKNEIISAYKKIGKLIERNSEVKFPTIWRDEKQSREEVWRRERLEERRVEEKE